MDTNGHTPEKSASDAEGVMFPTTPVWERNRKRRGFGGRRTTPETPAAVEPTVAPEPRTFARPETAAEPAMVLDRPMASTYGTATPRTVSEPEAEAGLVAPIARTDRTPRSGGVGAGALVAGVAALALIGGGGWYMMQNRDTVPELAPGGTPTAVATAPAALPPADMPPTVEAHAASTEPAPPPVQAKAPAAPTERRMASSTPRARPAQAPSAAAATGVDASDTLPDGPQPYSALNPGATPAPVNPTPSTAPTTAPESLPSTPPQQAAPAPAETPQVTTPPATEAQPPQ